MSYHRIWYIKITRKILLLQKPTVWVGLKEEILHWKPWKPMSEIFLSWRTQQFSISIPKAHSNPTYFSEADILK